MLSFACLAVFCLAKTGKYDAFKLPCEVDLCTRTEGREWTKMHEWTEQFDFDLLFLSLVDIDVSRDLADLGDNFGNI